MSNKKVDQPANLIRFITDLNVSTEGLVALNRMDGEDTLPFESDFYTPVFRLSNLAMRMRRIIKAGGINEVEGTLNPDTITEKLRNSDLQVKAVDILMLSKMVILEAFSFLYHSREDKEGLRYLTVDDINRTRENINYITDFLGTDESYHELITTFRRMNISFGYVEHQIELIRNTRGVR